MYVCVFCLGWFRYLAHQFHNKDTGTRLSVLLGMSHTCLILSCPCPQTNYWTCTHTSPTKRTKHGRPKDLEQTVGLFPSWSCFHPPALLVVLHTQTPPVRPNPSDSRAVAVCTSDDLRLSAAQRRTAPPSGVVFQCHRLKQAAGVLLMHLITSALRPRRCSR